MATRSVVIGSSVGLHARPAQKLVSAVSQSSVPVMIGKPGGEPTPANSLLGIMSLGIRHGETVELSADGSGADEILDELAQLLASDLDAQ